MRGKTQYTFQTNVQGLIPSYESVILIILPVFNAFSLYKLVKIKREKRKFRYFWKLCFQDLKLLKSYIELLITNIIRKASIPFSEKSIAK